jgi:hypothetical protein
VNFLHIKSKVTAVLMVNKAIGERERCEWGRGRGGKHPGAPGRTTLAREPAPPIAPRLRDNESRVGEGLAPYLPPVTYPPYSHIPPLPPPLPDPNIMADSDMAGPLVFCLALGFFLLLTGKLHFGYIYGFGMLGCGSLYLLVNLLADQGASLDLSRTFSVMGYCLLPIVMLSALSVLIDLKGTVGAVLGVSAIAWCTFAAARIFEAALGLSQHRWLIAYPALLFYACFALITIF